MLEDQFIIKCRQYAEIKKIQLDERDIKNLKEIYSIAVEGGLGGKLDSTVTSSEAYLVMDSYFIGRNQ